MLEILQPASAQPLVLRQLPVFNNEIATGFVDLALSRAFVYREHAESEVVDIPSEVSDENADARFGMLERLADYDDELMEQLLEEIEPPQDKVFRRSVARACRRAHRAGSDRLGGKRQRHPQVAQGACAMRRRRVAQTVPIGLP